MIGGSIEDATGNPDEPIFDLALAIERIRAAADAAADLPFLLPPPRAENYLWGRPHLKDTIARLQAFSDAGADVLYAPGLPNIDAIRTVCREVDKPVNVVLGSAVRVTLWINCPRREFSASVSVVRLPEPRSAHSNAPLRKFATLARLDMRGAPFRM